MLCRSALATPGGHGWNIGLEPLFVRPVRARRQLDQRVKRNLHPWTLLLGSVKEVGIDATEHSLMGHNDDVLTALQFHDDWFQANDNIPVRFSSAITVVVLVFVSSCEVIRILLGNILVSEPVAKSGVEFVQSLPFKLLKACFGGKMTSSLDCTLECRCPDDDLGVGWIAGFSHQFREGFRVSFASLGDAGIPTNLSN